jgi:hypothetical protein
MMAIPLIQQSQLFQDIIFWGLEANALKRMVLGLMPKNASELVCQICYAY